MSTIHLQRAAAGLANEERVSIEKRCGACEPGPGEAKVLALSVSDTARCGECRRPLWSGENYWAVLLPAGQPVDAES